MNYFAGLLLVVIGVVAIIYGDKSVQQKGGIVLKTFSHHSPLGKFLVKWTIGLVSILFGLGFFFGAIHL